MVARALREVAERRAREAAVVARMAGAVRALLADPAGRAKLAAAGRARVAAEFSRAAVVEQWAGLTGVSPESVDPDHLG